MLNQLVWGYDECHTSHRPERERKEAITTPFTLTHTHTHTQTTTHTRAIRPCNCPAAGRYTRPHSAGNRRPPRKAGCRKVHTPRTSYALSLSTLPQRYNYYFCFLFDPPTVRFPGSVSLYSSSARLWYFFGHSMYNFIASLSQTSWTNGAPRTAITFHIRDIKQPAMFQSWAKKGTHKFPCTLTFGWNTRESK